MEINFNHNKNIFKEEWNLSSGAPLWSSDASWRSMMTRIRIFQKGALGADFWIFVIKNVVVFKPSSISITALVEPFMPLFSFVICGIYCVFHTTNNNTKYPNLKTSIKGPASSRINILFSNPKCLSVHYDWETDISCWISRIIWRIPQNNQKLKTVSNQRQMTRPIIHVNIIKQYNHKSQE